MSVKAGERTCPNCGAQESRWTVDGREYVNLSPLTDQCVDCLAALAKETPIEQMDFGFDPRALAARNDA